VGVAADAEIVDVVVDSLEFEEDPPEQPARRAAMPAARMRALRRRWARGRRSERSLGVLG